VRRGHLAFLGKAVKRLQSPSASLDGEASTPRARARHDEILEKPADFDVCLKLEVSLFINCSPHILR
jgi:hypothetical protein